MPLSIKEINRWIRRIEASPLSIASFFAQDKAPFSQAQYFRYKAQLRGHGGEIFRSKRGRKRKIGREEELYLKGCLDGGSELSPERLRQMLVDEVGSEVSLATIRRTIERLYPGRERRMAGRPRSRASNVGINSLGGFELIVAVAHHLKWEKRTGDIIAGAVRDLKKGQPHQHRSDLDIEGRGKSGRFTGRYNRRRDVRTNRFASVSDKRGSKNWESMDIVHDLAKTLSRKSLAILALPIVTGNGSVRNVNLALGQTLGHLCGFNYKQKTINQFLSELKYLGISGQLLKGLPHFWQEVWGEDVSNIPGPVLCYYIDGNTKAVWSSKRVKKNKVTMLGRVMGCLEQVFIHDGLGHPVYFETYSGRAPAGEYVLGLFEKIEAAILEVPRSKTQVCRAIVMDAASNSVGTLRAFAAQDKYHYITTLDDNQWSERRVRNRSHPARYRYGEASLRDLEYELTDSHEKGFMIVSRAIKINWDNGKQTVLLTSLPKAMIDASEVVYSYFRRWPAQELAFRQMKAAVSLNRVSGYGKKLVSNERVKTILEKLKLKKDRLESELAIPIAAIADHDKALVKLVPEERRLRAKTSIKGGKRVIPRAIRITYTACGEKIRSHERAKQEIESAHAKSFRSLRKTQKEWLRLQGKDTVYQLDVELDQILTYFRASLANLCAYFIKHFLGGDSITMVMLIYRVLHLQADIEDSAQERKVTLRANWQDKEMMAKLQPAIAKLNDLMIRGNGARVYRFLLA